MIPRRRMMRAGNGFIENGYVFGGVKRSLAIEEAWAEGVVKITEFKSSRTLEDSTNMPARPPPKNMIEMDTCSRSCAVQSV